MPEQLKPLTSLRFFAALWVVVYGFWPKLAGVSGAPLLVDKGYLGVEVFFTLSGFILCHVYLPQAEAGRFRYGTFLWARLARIYPLHLACLAGIGALGGAALLLGQSIDPNILSLPALWPNLLLLHAWGLAPVSGWNHPSWSISAEWFAYLAFPAFAWLSMKLASRPRLALVLALGFLFALNAVFARLAGFALTESTIFWGALRIVPCFAYGCSLYLVWKSSAVQGRTRAALGASLMGAALLIGAAFGWPDPVLAAIGGGLILFLAKLAKTGESWFSHPILVYLGEISYSIYMVHTLWGLLFVNAAIKLLHIEGEQIPLWTWLILVAGVLPLSALSYHLVERPARDWLKRWSPGMVKRGYKITPA